MTLGMVKGCANPATVGLAMNVPAKGVALAEHDPIRILLGIMVCDGCTRKIAAKEFLGDSSSSLGTLLRVMCRKGGWAEPDFDRAFIAPVPLDGEEWKAFRVKGKDDAEETKRDKTG